MSCENAFFASVHNLFYCVSKCFPADKWRFDQNEGHIFIELLQISDKFHCQVSIILHRRDSVSVRVRLQECVKTKFDWDVKRGIEKRVCK